MGRLNTCPLFLLIWFATVILAILAGCAPPKESTSNWNANHTGGWKYSDIRLLEAPNIAEPAYDLIAIYARQSTHQFEIRVDLLDSTPLQAYDLYYAIDMTPGGYQKLPFYTDADVQWDLFIYSPWQSEPVIISQNDVLPSTFTLKGKHDPIIDSSTLSINSPDIDLTNAYPITIQVFLTPKGSQQAIDQIGPVNIFQQLVAPPAPLLLAFWDTLASDTPAQLLRSWNGAHSGPNGDRHGLSFLINSANAYQIPIVLLDLKTNKNLLGLEQLAGMTNIIHLSQQNLLILPDGLRTPPTNVLKDSPFLYGYQQLSEIKKYRNIFAHTTDTHHITNWNDLRFIPLPYDGSNSLPDNDFLASTQEFLSTGQKIKLLLTALSQDTADIVVIGESLPHSLWGSGVSATAFRYIAEHPWIHSMTRYDLLWMKAVTVFDLPLLCNTLLCPATSDRQPQPIPSLEKSIHALHTNQISDLAKNLYANLTMPSSDEKLNQLKQEHIPILYHFIQASQWADAPYSLSTCAIDIDKDQQNECILASESLFASFELDDGRLILMVKKQSNGQIIQWIGPTIQSAQGLSDSSVWQKNEQAQYYDPYEITGAFADNRINTEIFNAEILENKLILTNHTNTIVKRFNFFDDGLDVEYYSRDLSKIRIPAIVRSDKLLPFNLMVDAADISKVSCYDSDRWMSDPENAGRDYSPGHYLPYPFAILDIFPQKTAINITLR